MRPALAPALFLLLLLSALQLALCQSGGCTDPNVDIHGGGTCGGNIPPENLPYTDNGGQAPPIAGESDDAASIPPPTRSPLIANVDHSLDSPTLARIRSRLGGRGQLVCAHVDYTLGHSEVRSKTDASGMEPDLCRGLAASLGVEVEFWAMKQPGERFPLLQRGAVDVVFALTSKTIGRDMREGGTFSIPYFQDQHNFMYRTDSGIHDGPSLRQKKLCATRGTTNPNVLNDYLATVDASLGNQGEYHISLVDDDSEALRMMERNECQAFVNDDSVVAGYVHVEKPPAGVKYALASWPGTPFARAPFSAVTLDGDEKWSALVDWYVQSLYLAEMYAITSENVERLATRPEEAARLPGEAQRLLGLQPLSVPTNYGEGPLPPGTPARRLPFDIVQTVRSVGNYGEIYERNFGAFLPRSRANKLYQDGGAVFPAGFR